MKMRKARHRNWRSRKTWTFAPWYRVTTVAPNTGEAYLRALTTGEGWYRPLITGEIGIVEGQVRFFTSEAK